MNYPLGFIYVVVMFYLVYDGCMFGGIRFDWGL